SPAPLAAAIATCARPRLGSRCTPARLGSSASPDTTNTYQQTLRQAFRFNLERVDDHNPIEGLSVLQVLGEQVVAFSQLRRSHDQTVPPAEIESVLHFPGALDEEA